MAKAMLLCNLIMLLTVSQLRAQALKIGDTIPDTEIHNVFNYSSNTIRLSDFRKKYILLDFWSTNCKSCIQSFKKMDSLQRAFSKRLQIVLINGSSLDSTRNFFATHKKVFRPDIPFVTSDNLLHAYFPHDGEPFQVLVDTMGKIFSIPSYISFTSISKLVNGKESGFDQRIKRVYLKNALDERLQPFFCYSSCLVHSSSGVHLTGTPDNHEDSSYEGISMNYSPISSLYAKAYSNTIDGTQYEFLRPGRVIVESDKADFYFMPKTYEQTEIWLRNYSYSYQLLVKKDLHLNKYLLMQEDLRRVFPIQASIEKRKVRCLTLIRTSFKDMIASKGGQKLNTFRLSSVKDTHIDSIRMYLNGDYETFSKYLLSIIEFELKRPFVDATGINTKKIISLEMNGAKMDSLDVSAYREELRKYGLDLVEKEWVMDVLVLREKKRE